MNETMEYTRQTGVSFTGNALEEIRRLMAEEGFDQQLRLRVGVKGGGCSGLSYVLGFDQQDLNDDEFIFEGIHFIMNKAHALYLAGMEIDWKNGLDARGFIFTNPNASSTCGCGSSFAV